MAKFQKPYSDEQIAAAEAEVKRLESELGLTKLKLREMNESNYDAERAEQKRKAQKLTPPGRAVLVELAKENTRLWAYRGWRSSRTTYDFYTHTGNGARNFTKSGIHIVSATVDRLLLAGYVQRVPLENKRDRYDYSSTDYEITDAGREALKAGKS